MLKAKFKDSNGENIVHQEAGEKFQDFALRVWYKGKGQGYISLLESLGFKVEYFLKSPENLILQKENHRWRWAYFEGIVNTPTGIEFQVKEGKVEKCEWSK